MSTWESIDDGRCYLWKREPLRQALHVLDNGLWPRMHAGNFSGHLQGDKYGVWDWVNLSYFDSCPPPRKKKLLALPFSFEYGLSFYCMPRVQALKIQSQIVSFVKLPIQKQNTISKRQFQYKTCKRIRPVEKLWAFLWCRDMVWRGKHDVPLQGPETAIFGNADMHDLVKIGGKFL